MATDTGATLYLDLIGNGPGTGSTLSVDNFAVLVPPVVSHEFRSSQLAGNVGDGRRIVAADVDGDGRTDLLVTDGNGGIIVYRGDDRGGFARADLETSTFGSGPTALVAGNLTNGQADDFAYSLIDSGRVVSPLGVLPEPVDVTALVDVEYFDTQFNRATDTYTFFATITNNSNQSLAEPIALGWSNLSSANVDVLNADGVLTDGTIIFDLSGLAGDGVLEPGESTSARALLARDPLLEAFSFDTTVTAVVLPPSNPPATNVQPTASADAAINIGAAEVEVGGVVEFTVANGPGTAGDWIGLFALGSSDQQYLDWAYLNGSRGAPAPALSTGLLALAAPHVAGQYELRLFVSNSYERIAISDRFTVYGGDTEGPVAPVVTGFEADTGISSTDRISRDTTPTFHWSAATDDSGVAGYWWSINNPNPELSGTFTSERSVTTTVSGVGQHVFYVRAVDASPSGNLSAVASLPFTIDTESPTIVALSPAPHDILADGPDEILLRFSEPMDTTDQPDAAALRLTGDGVGQIVVEDAAWIDDRTARFSIEGQWAHGTVSVELLAGSLLDLAGNAVAGHVHQLSIAPDAPARLDISTRQINSGGLITVQLSGGPGLPEDRIGIYEIGASDSEPIDWLYLNGSKQLPDQGQRDVQWNAGAPTEQGLYEIRLISSGIAHITSPSFTVNGVEIFLDFDGGLLADLGGVVEVDGSTGRNHDAYQAFNGLDVNDQISQIVAAVQADFVDFAVDVIHDDQWQTNVRFGQEDTVIFVGGDGTWFSGENPEFNGTSVSWISGVAPWDRGNAAANVGFVFSQATAVALGSLGWSADRFVQHVANTTSHEIGHTFGVDHVTALGGAQEIMGTAETGTQISGDGVFSDVVLSRQHGGAYSSRQYLLDLLGPAAHGSGSFVVSQSLANSPVPLSDIHRVTADDSGTYAATVDFTGASRGDRNTVTANGIVNGAFATADPGNAAFGWTTRGDASVIAGAMQLREDEQFISGIQQTFVIPDTDTLRFTIDSANFAANGVHPPDALEVALLDASTLTSLVGTAAGLSGSDAFLNVQQTGQVYFAAGVSVPGTSGSGQSVNLQYPLTIELDVSGVTPGTEAILYFDLHGFGSLDSSVTIDNVRLLGPGLNQTATVKPGGPYEMTEGESLQLDGNQSSDPDGDSLSFSWDINGDGVFGDATGPAPSLGWTELRQLGIGAGAFTVSLQVDDGLGAEVATTSLTVNDAPPKLPTDTNSTDNRVAEGAADDTPVGITVSSTDPGDPSIPVTYTLLNDAGGRFKIDGTSGVVTIANNSLLNFEDATSHTITVEASNGQGGMSTSDFVINVQNVDPTDPVDNEVAANDVSESATPGTPVGVVAFATDPNGPVVTYSLLDNAGGRFTIDENSGAVTVAGGASLTGPATHTITVLASDGHGGTASSDFEINVVPDGGESKPLEITNIIVNNGERQRSNVHTLSVEFNQAAKIQQLIDSGAILDVIQIHGLTHVAQQVDLSQSEHYQWDAATNTLTIDLTVDGFGGSDETLLHDDNYQLQLNALQVLSAADPSQLLQDSDGTSDNVYRYDFHRLLSDLDGDKRVAIYDAVALRNHMFGIQTNAGADQDGDGDVDIDDLRLAMARIGIVLP